MLREIVFDTETTGLHVEQGDRIVEIGALELINHLPTGRTYHQYINPLREVPEDALKVHGLSTEFLKNYPKFSDIAKDFLSFVGDDGILVAHNASFDMGFINYELKHNGFETLEKHEVIDTLLIARQKFMNMQNNLDALCRRFKIDNSKRTKHGALLDAELLSEVYLELLGGAEPSMNFEAGQVKAENMNTVQRQKREPRHFEISKDEEDKHLEFLNQNITEPVWLK